jgi:hypothetical protein
MLPLASSLSTSFPISDMGGVNSFSRGECVA